jgi:L-amino acid N-acyltransferase YncA
MDDSVKLKDQSEIRIRPMRQDDLHGLVDFFKALPKQDREYLRRDVLDPEIVEARIREVEGGRVKRVVAVAEGQIVAEGALELEGSGWKRHVGELRLIVARSHRRKGLGVIMARELYHLAASEKVEELIVKMMRPQIAARKIFRRLGFHEEILMPEYVKDLEGKKQDLILMRCDLEALWQEIEDYYVRSDWRRTR